MWRVEVRICLELHSKDEELLHKINAYLNNIGSICNYKTRYSSCFYMSSYKNIITHILPHFDNYPIISQKQADYFLFRQVVVIIINNEHLNQQGFTNYCEH